jgi:hypothetical protein
VDWLTFDPVARMFVSTGAPTGAPNIVVRVEASDGSLSTYDDFVITTTAATDDYAATTATTGTLAAGSFARGTVNAPHDVDWYQVVLSGGQSYTFDLKGTSTSGSGTLADPRLLGLYDGAGAAVADATVLKDYAGTDDRLVYAPTTDGTFYIAASGQGGEAGTYAISLSSGSNAVPELDATAADAAFLTDAHLGQRYLEAREGQAFAFQLPSNVFADAASEQLTFSATLGNGAALPAWLTFNAATRTFSGTPPAAGNDLDIRLTARDPLGQFAAMDFTLRTPPAASAPPAKWTVMVYVAADSAHAQYALKDLNELESVLMPSGVNIVVMWDGSGAADTKRGKLSYDIDMATFRSVLAALPEKNMGDPATLTEFLDWGASNYRADNYALVVWDRNGGGFTGTAVDATSGRASLSASELTRAIDQSTIGKVDLLGFDSNLSANIEQLTEVSGQADYVVAPETLAKADGWDYAGWLLKLAANPLQDDEALATAAQDSYYAYYGLNADTRLQNLGSSQVDSLVAALGDFVTSAGIMTDIKDDLAAAAEANRMTGDASLMDLRGFMGSVVADADIGDGTADLQLKATAVADALTAALGTGGSLSVFMPGADNLATVGINESAAGAADYNAGNYRFVSETNWNSFITTLYS